MSNAMRQYLVKCFTNGYEFVPTDHAAVLRRKRRNRAQVIRLVVVFATGFALGALL